MKLLSYENLITSKSYMYCMDIQTITNKMKKILLLVSRQTVHMSPFLLVIAALFFMMVFAIGKDAIQINRRADAAIFEQLSENIWQGKGAISNVFAASQNFIERKYAKSRENLIGQPLIPPAEEERNMLTFHAYWILFPLAPFSHFIGNSLFLTFIQTACFLGLLTGALYLVRRETGNWLPALVFTPFVLLSPNWLGGIMGQFYPDRIFIFAAFLLCWLLYYNSRVVFLVLAAFLVALINERAALIGGVMCLLIPLCTGSENASPKRYIAPVVLGVALILYAYLARKYLLTNAYYDTFLPNTYALFKERLLRAGYIQNSLMFILANGVLIAFSLINPRLAAIPLLVMALNLVGSIGGAEKVGWTTHYHTYYFPILVFTASVGFSRLFKRYRASLFVPVALALVLAVLSKEIKDGHAPDSGQFARVFQSASDRLHGRPTGYQIKSRIIANIPQSSFVSTDELGAALLNDRAFIDIFPVSMNRADYLFLPCELFNKPNLAKSNDFDLRNLERFPEIARCLAKRRG